MKLPIAFLALAALAMTCQTPSVRAEGNNRSQTARIRSLNSEAVKRVFEFSTGVPAEFQEIDYRIVVRFLPSFGREYQIVIVRRPDGSTRVVEYRLGPGSRSIHEESIAVLGENPDATVQDVLNRISVQKKEREAGEAVTRLVGELFKLAIPTRLSIDLLCVDGTMYELWVQTLSGEIHASLTDCSFGEDTSAQPLIRWMRAIRAELEDKN